MLEKLPVVVPCKSGRMQIGGGTVSVLGLFGKQAWSAECSDVMKIAVQTGERNGTVDMAFYTSQGIVWAESIMPTDVKTISDVFPTTEIQHIELKGRREWYHDQIKLTYVATYKDDKSMRKEIEAASQFGWVPQ